MRTRFAEPWKAAGPEVRSADGKQIALVLGQIDDMRDRRDRIIACVNACAGIATSDLTSGIVSEWMTMSGVRPAAEPTSAFSRSASSVDH